MYMALAKICLYWAKAHYDVFLSLSEEQGNIGRAIQAE
jgi:hypothetical protein